MITAEKYQLGQRVIINIKDANRYTSDLYSSVNGAYGYVIQMPTEIAGSYLILISPEATEDCCRWAGCDSSEDMAWWIESDDLESFWQTPAQIENKNWNK